MSDTSMMHTTPAPAVATPSKTKAPRKPRKTSKAAQPSTVHVLFVIDSSGSMAFRANDVRGGFNEYVATLKRDITTDYRLMAVTFDTEVKTLFADQPLADVPALTYENYRPGGSTALYDALGVSLDELTTAVKTADKVYGTDRVLVIVMTDGEENASRRFTKEIVVGKMQRREAAKNWTFVYLGADQNAWAAAQHLGFAVGNTASCASVNTRGTFSQLAVSTQSYSITSAATGSIVDFGQSLSNAQVLAEQQAAALGTAIPTTTGSAQP